MPESKKIKNPEVTNNEKISLAIKRFSGSLADLREFTELVEGLIKTHKLKELETAVTRYEGLGEALSSFDSKLMSDLGAIERQEDGGEQKKTLKFEVVDHSDGVKIFKAAGSRDELKEFDKSIGAVFKTESSVQQLHRSSLISLVSMAETFLSQLLHLFFEKHPSALNVKDKQFSFEELSNFSSLDDARAYLVSWRIENLLRGSYEDWIDYFRTQMKLELAVTTKHYDQLVENFQRRNLFVHNDGVVNKIYLSKIHKSLAKPELLNKRLSVSKEYLFAAIDRFEASFLQLAFELWTKCDKSEESRPGIIINSSYDALQHRRWMLATELAGIVEADKAATESDKLMAKVNSWIARKKIGAEATLRDEIQSFDVSAKNDLFKLAKHCLLDEHELALAMAKQLEKSQMLGLKELTEWPLFEDLRATKSMAHWMAKIKVAATATPKSKIAIAEPAKKKVGSVRKVKTSTPAAKKAKVTRVAVKRSKTE